MTMPLKSLFLRLPRSWRLPLQQAWRRLPPRDLRFKLQGIQTEAQALALLASADYPRFVRQEMTYWGGYQEGPDAASPVGIADEPLAPPSSAPPAYRQFQYFTEHPIVHEAMARRARSDAPDLWAWLADSLGGREQGLVLGAGDGNHCRLLIDYGIVRRVTAYDLAEASVARARAAMRRLGYAIDYQVGDLNFLALDEAPCDLCLALHSLHHLVNLEGLTRRLAGALAARRGMLVVEDYVGPRYTELPRAGWRHIGRWLRRLPERLRLARDGRSRVDRPPVHDRWSIQRNSPFEAIRSDQIVPVLRRSFQVEEYRELGGGLLMPLLGPIIHNFNPDDAEANDWLRQMIDDDLNLTRRGEIPNAFVFLTARPR